ncbi:uncharacterized protein LACBIDRAFT_322493 [Laccaria bicolor S238N-H82]|uniref:Predicted protein n=1 Tax=Laccaria bicolor (strain S238N-H82 / ATCC MYA-4686) TaxID=486041 RepID=B0CWH3_LACBS|nr:uncharacterized protein LACBIDRAFT_322493 [Laccaria bicolor S238N-H82]EDR13508.1 predicted protein [Laccaria bicolor S238N-H82]|eukprot:XP_001876006.1 predicted protein [Laccaria bicolor S238N-H82]
MAYNNKQVATVWAKRSFIRKKWSCNVVPNWLKATSLYQVSHLLQILTGRYPFPTASLSLMNYSDVSAVPLLDCLGRVFMFALITIRGFLRMQQVHSFLSSCLTPQQQKDIYFDYIMNENVLPNLPELCIWGMFNQRYWGMSTCY